MSRLRIRLSAQNKDLFRNKSIDLMLIILGITIAFQLNKMKERSDTQNLEHYYLESLISDIDKDIISFNHILLDLKIESTATSQCLATNDSETLSQSVLNILSFETFNYRNDNTYMTLVNGQGLSVIGSSQTRNQITEYYKCYKSIDRFEYVYTEFLLHDFHPYFASYVDYQSGMIDELPRNELETRNQLSVVIGQLTDGIETYTYALSRATDLRNALLNQ